MRDTRLARESARNLPKGELLWKLMEPAWGHEPTEGTRGQQMLALTTFFIRDVCNGGLDQALYNFEPSSVDFVLKSLDELGAAEHAAAVRDGMHALWGPNPPATLDGRRRVIDGRSAGWMRKYMDPLSERLYDEERLEPHFLGYVEAHPSEFFID